MTSLRDTESKGEKDKLRSGLQKIWQNLSYLLSLIEPAYLEVDYLKMARRAAGTTRFLPSLKRGGEELAKELGASSSFKILPNYVCELRRVLESEFPVFQVDSTIEA